MQSKIDLCTVACMSYVCVMQLGFYLLICTTVSCWPMEGKQVTTIVVGAGSRGSNYANYALDFPQKFKVISYVVFSVLFTALVPHKGKVVAICCLIWITQ